MKKLSVLLAVFLLGLSAPVAQAKEAFLSMVYTNALGDALPFDIFSKGSWSPDPQARFVKLHMYFDEPIQVKSVEIDTCGSEFKDRVWLFFNFDRGIPIGVLFNEDRQESFAAEPKEHLLSMESSEAIETRSLTMNFGSNTGFRICGIHFKDPEGENYQIRTPVLTAGKVEASSVMEPRSAYDPTFLFDSRFEYGWASKKATDESLSFNFDEPVKIEKIRIWNGYQRSVVHCYSNSRASRIRLTGDDGYDVEVKADDILGSQVIDLPKPFQGRQLKMEMLESFHGKKYEDLVISEVRFFNGSDWFMLDPSSKLREGLESNRTQFAKASTKSLLNDSYVTTDYRMSVTLRLRADGSFFISGDTADFKGFFALGSYDVRMATPDKGLMLKLSGLYYEYSKENSGGDCNGCGRDCNLNTAPDGSPGEVLFNEFITLKPSKDGTFEMINGSGGRFLKFKKVYLSREKENVGEQ